MGIIHLVYFWSFFFGGGGEDPIMGIEEYSVDKQPFTTSIFIIKSTKDYTFFLVYSMFDSCSFSGFVFAIR